MQVVRDVREPVQEEPNPVVGPAETTEEDHAAGLLTYRRLARALGRDVAELVADGEVLPPRR